MKLPENLSRKNLTLLVILLIILLSLPVAVYLVQKQIRYRGKAATGIIWSTSHETGDLSDWYKNQSGAVYNTGDAEISVTDEMAHTGRYSARHEVWGIDQTKTATRIFRWAEHLTEGYYSCWQMFPELPQVNSWLNIFQFKKKNYSTGQVDPTWYNEVKNKPQGTVLTLTHWEQEWDISPNVNDAIPLQPNEWFHIEWYYKDGISDGIIKIWQNGVLIWDLRNVNTRGIDPDIQWAPSLYGDRVNPGHLVMYMDDCVISSQRVGPGYFNGLTPAPQPTITPTPTISGPTNTPTPTLTLTTTITPTQTPVPTPNCPEQAKEGDYDCNGEVNESDFESWRGDYLEGETTLSFFEYWRRRFFSSE